MYTLDIQLYNNVQSQKTTYFSKLFFFGTRRPLHRLEQFYLSALLTRQEMTKKCSPARSSLSSWFAVWGKKKKKIKNKAARRNQNNVSRDRAGQRCSQRVFWADCRRSSLGWFLFLVNSTASQERNYLKALVYDQCTISKSGNGLLLTYVFFQCSICLRKKELIAVICEMKTRFVWGQKVKRIQLKRLRMACFILSRAPNTGKRGAQRWKMTFLLHVFFNTPADEAAAGCRHQTVQTQKKSSCAIKKKATVQALIAL